MYKVLLFLAPCLLSIALVHSFISGGGLGGGVGYPAYGGGYPGYGSGYPFNTYANTVAQLNGNGAYGLNDYQNPNRWSFLFPLVLSLLLAFNKTKIPTTG